MKLSQCVFTPIKHKFMDKKYLILEDDVFI